MVRIGSGTEREIEDIMLTRYACYLIAQNGDPRSLPAPERLHKLNDIAISQMRSLLTDHHIKRLAS
jgi:hypothetical protein